MITPLLMLLCGLFFADFFLCDIGENSGTGTCNFSS